MKRNITLVSYESSDEETSGGPDQRACTDVLFKRKLPRISPSLTVPVPVSNPALHQGRVRTTPHVEGQFAAFVYIPVALEDTSELHKLLEEAVLRAKDIEPTLKCDWPGTERRPCELHISLTRPIYLRHYQREELKRAVKAAARAHDPFTASFSTFATFENDERTRAFLGVEVGAGHSEFKSLSKSLEPALKLLHQKEFYSEPRFHASIAWASLAPELMNTGAPNVATPSPMSTAPGTPEVQTHNEHKTILSFPSSMLSELNTQFGYALSSRKVGAFEVERVEVKIGKDVFSWDLGGSK
ncbi:hypothetical protein M0805_008588 [Coniferiporia weirii]|nr:hypothetical protein M0805_008588 [Coniferiporia weirii]